ncbi:MAG TPA: gamma-glutamyltransferase, partial [Microlunatus sp.]|nr:gamma-glutamyltransferase [Microlunatus sp.]
AAYVASDPNRIQGGKRPRSSMSPTIVLDRQGRPVYAVGSPGGSTIITTVLQTLVNRIDLGMTLPEAVAAPRASHRNTEDVTAEPAFIEQYGDALGARGYSLVPERRRLHLRGRDRRGGGPGVPAGWVRARGRRAGPARWRFRRRGGPDGQALTGPDRLVQSSRPRAIRASPSC